MYEPFTDQARKVMRLANQAAQRLKHEYIATEHILLGLIELGEGIGFDVLKKFDINVRDLRSDIEKIIQAGTCAIGDHKLPQTPRAKKVIEYAIEEAGKLKHHYVGTEHILLGLLRERDGVAAQVLLNRGVKLDQLRAEVFKLLGIVPPLEVPQKSDQDMHAEPKRSAQTSIFKNPRPRYTYEHFTDRARKVMQLANQEAQRCGHEYIGTEHVLLGLVKEWSGVGASVLKNLGIAPARIRLAIERLVQSRPDVRSTGKLPQTPRTQNVVQYAIEEADRLQQNYVGTEHICWVSCASRRDSRRRCF